MEFQTEIRFPRRRSTVHSFSIRKTPMPLQHVSECCTKEFSELLRCESGMSKCFVPPHTKAPQRRQMPGSTVTSLHTVQTWVARCWYASWKRWGSGVNEKGTGAWMRRSEEPAPAQLCASWSTSSDMSCTGSRGSWRKAQSAWWSSTVSAIVTASSGSVTPACAATAVYSAAACRRKGAIRSRTTSQRGTGPPVRGWCVSCSPAARRRRTTRAAGGCGATPADSAMRLAMIWRRWAAARMRTSPQKWTSETTAWPLQTTKARTEKRFFSRRPSATPLPSTISSRRSWPCAAASAARGLSSWYRSAAESRRTLCDVSAPCRSR
mmetsp:Transcript_425/g.1478  ORF Transcript_425/g.1478 Transcript_425/m.1478 type:complete len:322 (+) Transcript_425:202-1167(+)